MAAEMQGLHIQLRGLALCAPSTGDPASSTTSIRSSGIQRGNGQELQRTQKMQVEANDAASTEGHQASSV